MIAAYVKNQSPENYLSYDFLSTKHSEQAKGKKFLVKNYLQELYNCNICAIAVSRLKYYLIALAFYICPLLAPL